MAEVHRSILCDQEYDDQVLNTYLVRTYYKDHEEPFRLTIVKAPSESGAIETYVYLRCEVSRSEELGKRFRFKVDGYDLGNLCFESDRVNPSVLGKKSVSPSDIDFIIEKFKQRNPDIQDQL